MTEPDATEVPSSPPASSRIFDWRTNLALFLFTVAAVLLTGGPAFAAALFAILLAHEFGHYIAARIHRVPASLPYFLPLPFVSPFGTLGAVILMPGRIRSRNALLDIGAAGPLAGMVVAIPMMLYGLSLSKVGPTGTGEYIQEGQSLLYWALKAAVFGKIPSGSDVLLHPVAYGAWAGFFVTFLNLLPFGQLDGGHIAYALFGTRQDRAAGVIRYVPLVLAVYNYARPIIAHGSREGLRILASHHFFDGPAVSWVVLFALLSVMRWFAGANHPPVDRVEFGSVRRAIAVGSLLLFLLLFMPTPLEAF
jgi:membrane-associated protease RseP (regulator of RpoE activity)